MRQDVLINAVCLAICAIALGVIVAVVFTGEIAMYGIDALFILSVCLVTILVFGWIPATTIRNRIPRWRKEEKPVKKVERQAVAAANKPEETS